MFILEKPYVSEELLESAAALGLPVLDTSIARTLCRESCSGVDFLPEGAFAERFLSQPAEQRRLYSNSENSLEWVAKHLAQTELPQRIELCKDKVAFRKILQPLFPEFFFCEVLLAELDNVDPESFQYPCVIKPSVGFFSLGVHLLQHSGEWPAVLAALKEDVRQMNRAYPQSVVSSARFIVEQLIEGDEYAVDAYFDGEGTPVILNIFKHDFSGAEDVSDRLYYTSCDVIRETLPVFTSLLEHFGRAADMKNFPVHLEARIGPDGVAIPIEANPMRFAGWCVTDLARYAWGIDVYKYYFQGLKPDWTQLQQGREGKLFAMMIGDLPAGVSGEDVQSVDYEAFAACYEKPLALRRINWTKYPVFAFIFTETNANDRRELDAMLRDDMRRFLTMKAE